MSTTPKVAPDVRADEIIERLKRATGVQTDGDLAELLGVTRTTLSNWRSRNSVPLSRLRPVCRQFAIPLDYVVSGRLGPDKLVAAPMDTELLGYVFKLLARYGFIGLPEPKGKGHDPARRAAAEFVMLQEQTRELLQHMTTSRRMTVAEAKKAVLSKLKEE